MTRILKRLLPAITALALLTTGPRYLTAGSSGGDKTAPKPATATGRADGKNAKLIRQLIERLEKVEAELARIKGAAGKIPPAAKDRKLLMMIERPYIGTSYYSSKRRRYFVARLLFINLTAHAVTIKRDEISLDVDGTVHPLKEIPKKMQSYSFQVGTRSESLRNLQPAKETRISAGGTASTWIVWTDLPTGGDVPSMKIKAMLAGKQSVLDVNEYALGQLGLTVEQIGPHGSLGLLTISGKFNTINVGALVDALDKLTDKKIVRAVIRWTDSAAPLDSQLLSWLTNAANLAGRGQVRNDNRYPVIPVAIRELHLAQIPNQRSSSSSSGSQTKTPRVHKTDVDAVTAALRTAYQVLPRDELLREIQTGSRLTRIAALAGGGGRLAEDKLPILLKLADDKDPQIQAAALFALRSFGAQAAIDKLLHYVRKNTEPLAGVAVESLAASRYDAAHQSLLKVLRNEPPSSKKTIVRVLARYPRPIWSETIYGFVKSSDPTVSVEALRALVQIGHPKLIDVLADALKSGNTPMRNEAFSVLVSRPDSRSEKLAMDYTLSFLKTAPPTPQMLSLLNRTKDRRAIPLLIALLDNKKNRANRSQLISVLAAIGDESVADVLVRKYPKLQSSEKAAALTALLQLRSPRFRKLAGSALMTTNSSLINTACQGLQRDGSPEAVRLLSDALDKTSYSSAWSYISNALATLATPAARAALQRALRSSNTRKQSYARSALRNLRYRSPGYQYIYQAQQFVRSKNWKEAITRYSTAIKLDPALPEAYVGRANALHHLKKNAEALKDYQHALKLDPTSSPAITGTAITLAIAGRYEDGIKMVEAARTRFQTSNMFAYNTACVYGRAYEYVQKNKKLPGRDQKLATYRTKALAELQRAVKLRFRQFDLMKTDPDLKAISTLLEFKKIVDPSGSGKRAATPRPFSVPTKKVR